VQMTTIYLVLIRSGSLKQPRRKHCNNFIGTGVRSLSRDMKLPSPPSLHSWRLPRRLLKSNRGRRPSSLKANKFLLLRWILFYASRLVCPCSRILYHTLWDHHLLQISKCLFHVVLDLELRVTFCLVVGPHSWNCSVCRFRASEWPTLFLKLLELG
jgi:hypothetical protein